MHSNSKTVYDIEDAFVRRSLNALVIDIIYSKGFITRDPYYGYDPDMYNYRIDKLIKKVIQRHVRITKGRCLSLLQEIYNAHFSDEDYVEYCRIKQNEWSKNPKKED